MLKLSNIYDLLLNLTIYILVTCWSVNKGKMYFEKTKIRASKVKNENDNWFKKKNGINCGIFSKLY